MYKQPSDLSDNEILEEIESHQFVLKMCREIGQGISTKEVIRNNACTAEAEKRGLL